jgi:hypothetical protein
VIISHPSGTGGDEGPAGSSPMLSMAAGALRLAARDQGGGFAQGVNSCPTLAGRPDDGTRTRHAHKGRGTHPGRAGSPPAPTDPCCGDYAAR